MATNQHPPVTDSRETLWAIVVSGVISLVLATVLIGSPFRAFGLGYHDYSAQNTEGLKPASTTQAPAGAQK